MNFKDMKKLEPGLGDLERRMTAMRRFIGGYFDSDSDDLESILSGANRADLGWREELCVSRLEARFARTLLLLVGPNGMHPMLKEPEHYTLARQHLWRRFPVCGPRCSCQREMVGS